MCFVATNTCLLQQNYVCRDTHTYTFVATKDVFWRDKHVFVATKLLSQQKRYLWHLPPVIPTQPRANGDIFPFVARQQPQHNNTVAIIRLCCALQKKIKNAVTSFRNDKESRKSHAHLSQATTVRTFEAEVKSLGKKGAGH